MNVEARHKNFKELRAEFSERLRSNGAYEGFSNVPVLLAPLKQQYAFWKEKIKELERIAKERNLTEQERILLSDFIRKKGDMVAQLRKAGQMAFERAFITIAHARLPKEHFLIISEEARELWQMEGFGDIPLPPQKKIRKNLKRFFRSKMNPEKGSNNV